MPEVKLNGKRKAENGKLFSEIREIRDLRSLAIPFSLFSLNSLNSLYSLLPGIVFDTHEGEGELFCCMEECPLFLPGIVFDTYQSVSVPSRPLRRYRFRYPCTKQANYNSRVSESSLPSFCIKFSMLTMRSAEGRFVPLM